jgi:hypothetical protein
VVNLVPPERNREAMDDGDLIAAATGPAAPDSEGLS